MDFPKAVRTGLNRTITVELSSRKVWLVVTDHDNGVEIVSLLSGPEARRIGLALIEAADHTKR